MYSVYSRNNPYSQNCRGGAMMMFEIHVDL